MPDKVEEWDQQAAHAHDTWDGNTGRSMCSLIVSILNVVDSTRAHYIASAGYAGE